MLCSVTGKKPNQLNSQILLVRENGHIKLDTLWLFWISLTSKQLGLLYCTHKQKKYIFLNQQLSLLPQNRIAIVIIL